jgi:hypothetical protein
MGATHFLMKRLAKVATSAAAKRPQDRPAWHHGCSSKKKASQFEKMTNAASPPKSKAVNASARAFLRDQDPSQTWAAYFCLRRRGISSPSFVTTA